MANGIDVCTEVDKSLATHWNKSSGLGKIVLVGDVVIEDSFPCEFPSEDMFLLTELLNISVSDETLFMGYVKVGFAPNEMEKSWRHRCCSS